VVRKEAWPFYRTISGVCLCWELEEPTGSKGAKAPDVVPRRALATLGLHSLCRDEVDPGIAQELPRPYKNDHPPRTTMGP